MLVSFQAIARGSALGDPTPPNHAKYPYTSSGWVSASSQAVSGHVDLSLNLISLMDSLLSTVAVRALPISLHVVKELLRNIQGVASPNQMKDASHPFAPGAHRHDWC